MSYYRWAIGILGILVLLSINYGKFNEQKTKNILRIFFGIGGIIFALSNFF